MAHFPGTEKPNHPPRILLIDDQELLADLTRENLQFLGFQVDVFTDSVAALEAFRSQPDHWDLIVSDETMPRLSGIDLAQTIRSEGGKQPVIITTGYSRPQDQSRIAALGRARLLLKPFPISELADLIRSLLND